MKYVAEDGTEFSTEQECMEYEATQKRAVEEQIRFKEEILREIDESTSRINQLLTEYCNRYPDDAGVYTGFCLRYRA